jgi:signal transduction histidine kinase
MAVVVIAAHLRRLAGLAALPTVWVVLLTVVTGLELPAELSSPSGRYQLPWRLVVLTLAAVAVTAASVLSLAVARHPRTAWGLAWAGTGLMLPMWAAWPVVTPWLAPLLLAFGPLTVAGAAAVTGARQAGVTYVLSSLAALALALGYDPFADVACLETCVARPAPLAALLSTRAAIALAGWLTVAASGLAAIGLRPVTTSSPRALVGVAALGLLTLAALLRLAAPRAGLWLAAQHALPAISVLMVAGSVVVAELGRARTRRAVDRLVAGLSAPASALTSVRRTGPAGWLRARPRSAVQVLFSIPGSARWIDAQGTEIVPGSGPSLVLSDGSVPVVRLGLSHPSDEPVVLEALTPGARLALRNAQLAAVGRARLDDVRASRRRIVTTSDAERRRIERDLHDGAQQRLVSVALHLQVARARVEPPTAERLQEAELGVREALLRLRRLAHGVQPSGLAQDGLLAAVEELAAGSELPITMDLDLGATLDADTAMAAYTTIADLLDGLRTHPLADGGAVAVQARRNHGHVFLRLIAPTTSTADRVATVDRALAQAADRVAVLGGTLSVTGRGPDIEVRAVIPCEWS